MLLFYKYTHFLNFLPLPLKVAILMHVTRYVFLFLIVLDTAALLRLPTLSAKALELSPSFQSDSIVAYSDNAGSSAWLLRLLPQLDTTYSFGKLAIDSSIIGMFSGLQTRSLGEPIETSSSIHRGWLRFRSSAHELRLGVQKINFGTAKVLRSLQWFDQVDPLDPLSYTPGVQGGLWRHYTEDSGNIWLWGLLNNRRPLGDFGIVTKKDQIEYGGRLQLPPSWFEFAFSFHNRSVEVSEPGFDNGIFDDSLYEQRFGIDAIWDGLIGLWIESSLSLYSNDAFFVKRYLSTTVGGDYTFSIGNGLYTNVEFMARQAEMSYKRSDLYMVSLNQSYPISFYETARLFLISCLDCKYSTARLEYQQTFDQFFYTISLLYTMGSSDLAVSRESSEESSVDGAGLNIAFQLNI